MRIKVTERQFKLLLDNLHILPKGLTLQARAKVFKRFYGSGNLEKDKE
jgi:hypothetical protein